MPTHSDKSKVLGTTIVHVPKEPCSEDIFPPNSDMAISLAINNELEGEESFRAWDIP